AQSHRAAPPRLRRVRRGDRRGDPRAVAEDVRAAAGRRAAGERRAAAERRADRHPMSPHPTSQEPAMSSNPVRDLPMSPGQPAAPEPQPEPAGETNPIREAITEAIASHKVILFMKGTPEAPA